MDAEVVIVIGIVVSVLIGLASVYDMIKIRHYQRHPPDRASQRG